VEAKRRRRTIKFRCSDEAYERLFRRQSERSGDPEVGGRRFDRVLREYLAIVEQDHGVHLLHPGDREEPGSVRQLTIDSELADQLDQVAKKAPVSRETLVREAIWRFTGMC
jgi:predicted DNA-binding protein